MKKHLGELQKCICFLLVISHFSFLAIQIIKQLKHILRELHVFSHFFLCFLMFFYVSYLWLFFPATPPCVMNMKESNRFQLAVLGLSTANLRKQ